MDRYAISLAIIGMLLSASAVAQGADPAPPSARELHAAQCVAALDANTRQLAQDVKAGKEEAKLQLQRRLEAGTAFVGDAYLHGTHDEARARALAADAQKAQQDLPPKVLAARQDACADEGSRLVQASNVLERAVVRRFALKRMEKLLAG